MIRRKVSYLQCLRNGRGMALRLVKIRSAMDHRVPAFAAAY